MSFFGSIGKFFKKAFGSEQTWERIASTALTVVAPLTETIVGLTAGEPAGAAVAAIMTEIQNDLAAVNAVVNTAGGSSATVESTLKSVIANLQSLLTAGHIKDPATLSKVTVIVNTLTAEIEAILQAMPTVSAGGTSPLVPGSVVNG